MEPITTSNRVSYLDAKDRLRTPETMLRATCTWLREALLEVSCPQLEKDVSSIDIRIRADGAGWHIVTRTT